MEKNDLTLIERILLKLGFVSMNRICNYRSITIANKAGDRLFGTRWRICMCGRLYDKYDEKLTWTEHRCLKCQSVGDVDE